MATDRAHTPAPLHENHHAEERTSHGVLSFRRLTTFHKFARTQARTSTHVEMRPRDPPRSVLNFDITTSRYSAGRASTERLFLPPRRPVITFSLFGFYSCKYLDTIRSLASEFQRGTRSASQLHTSLIEKAAAGAAAAAASPFGRQHNAASADQLGE